MQDYTKTIQDFFSRFQEKVNTTYKEIIASKMEFVDPDFPPDKSSLFNKYVSYLSNSSYNSWNKFIWLKADLIFQGHFDVFGNDGISPDTIKQGCLGNCYFICALASAAINKERIEKLFIVKKYNVSGLYIMKVFVNGRMINICVDDYFPVSPDENEPAFAHSQDNLLWVMLLEKCWAKVSGTYENTVGGSICESLTFLTGAPCFTYENSKFDPEKLWFKIEMSVAKNYIIGASTREDYAKSMNSSKLLSLHGYSILGAYQIIQNNSAPLRLIQLRNPWGSFEWNGDWSKGSPLWTNEIKTAVQFFKNSRGSFYMSFHDFLTYFDTTYICKVHDNFEFNYIDSSINSREYKIFKFTISQKVEGFISLFVPSFRILSHCIPNYKKPFISILVAKLISLSPIKYEMILGKCNNNDYCSVKFLKGLEPGDYIVIPCLVWNTSGVSMITISSYSNIPITFVEDKTLISQGVVLQVITSAIIKRGCKKYLDDYNTISEIEAIKQTKSMFCGIYLQNKNPELRCVLHYTFTSIENLELVMPLNIRGNVVKIILPPLSETLILFRRVDTGYSCDISTSISIEPSRVRRNDFDLFPLSPQSNYPHLNTNPRQKSSKSRSSSQNPEKQFTDKEIINIGNEIQRSEEYSLSLHSLQVDNQLFAAIYNTSNSQSFKGTISLSIENLESKQKLTFALSLEPSKAKIIKFTIIDPKVVSKLIMLIHDVLSPTSIKISAEENKAKIDDLLLKIINNGKSQIITMTNKINDITFYEFNYEGFFYLLFINISPNEKAACCLHIQKNENLIIDDPFVKDGIVTVEIEKQSYFLKQYKLIDSNKLVVFSYNILS